MNSILLQLSNQSMAPAVGYTVNGGLRIEITDPKPVYLPGHVIEGYVHLDANHGPYKSIIVELYGHSRVETILGSGLDRKENYGSAPLMKVPVTLTDAFVNPEPQPRSWAFSIPVPATLHQLPRTAAPVTRTPGLNVASEQYTIADHLDWPGLFTNKGYISNTRDVSNEPIPSVFYHRKEYEEQLFDQESRGEAYVEYYLRASGDNRLKMRPTATYPVNIRNPAPDKPIADSTLR